jgi:hypothetical protein
MLYALENTLAGLWYTNRHLAEIKKLTFVEEIDNYNYTTEYFEN